MFNKIMLIIICIAVAICLVSCGFSKSATDKYLKAVSTTDNASSMESKTEFTLDVDLSKADKEIAEDLDKFKKIKITNDTQINSSKDKSKSNIFISFSDSFMINVILYTNKDNVFAKTSFTGDKYINFNSFDSTDENKSTINEDYYYQLYMDIFNVWNNEIKKQILAKEGSTTVITPDGDIKVTELSLKMDDESFKNILRSMAKALSESEAIRKIAIEHTKINPNNKIYNDIEDKIDKFYNKLPEHFEDIENDIKVENMNLTAKIDRDSFIIDESLEGTVSFKNIKIDFSKKTRRWNINNNVQVDIPQVDKDDFISFDDIQLKHKKWNDMFNVER